MLFDLSLRLMSPSNRNLDFPNHASVFGLRFERPSRNDVEPVFVEQSFHEVGGFCMEGHGEDVLRIAHRILDFDLYV